MLLPLFCFAGWDGAMVATISSGGNSIRKCRCLNAGEFGWECKQQPVRPQMTILDWQRELYFGNILEKLLLKIFLFPQFLHSLRCCACLVCFRTKSDLLCGNLVSLRSCYWRYKDVSVYRLIEVSIKWWKTEKCKRGFLPSSSFATSQLNNKRDDENTQEDTAPPPGDVNRKPQGEGLNLNSTYVFRFCR